MILVGLGNAGGVFFSFRPGGASEPETKKKRSRKRKKNAPAWRPETKKKRSRKPPKKGRLGGRKRRENVAGNEKKGRGPARGTGPEKGSRKRGPETMFFGFSTRNAAECAGFRLKRTETKAFPGLDGP